MSKYISEVKGIPSTEHYAVLSDQKMTYDDGYGREGHESYLTLEYMQYISFQTKQELEEWILSNRDKSFKVIMVKPVTVKTTISIDVEID